MPEPSNMIDEAESKTYCENCHYVVPMPSTPIGPPNETMVVKEGPFSVVATDDATPLPRILSDENAPAFAANTAAHPSLASSYPTAPASRPPKNFIVTIPMTVHLPVEAFYRNFPTDASGRRRVITRNLTYDVAVDLPETRMPTDVEPPSTSYARPVNPYSSTTAQYQPIVTSEPESLPCSVTGHNEDAPDAPDAPLSDEQRDTDLPGEARRGEILEPTSSQNAPQLVKRPSEEEVIGHNWIKFQDEEQPHASLNNSQVQMTTMQERHAPRDSRRAVLRSALRNIREKLKGAGDYEGNKLIKGNKLKKQRRGRASKIFDF